jgi:hypothetical protein
LERGLSVVAAARIGANGNELAECGIGNWVRSIPDEARLESSTLDLPWLSQSLTTKIKIRDSKITKNIFPIWKMAKGSQRHAQSGCDARLRAFLTDSVPQGVDLIFLQRNNLHKFASQAQASRTSVRAESRSTP